MGFPTPINDWFRDDLKDFVTDVLSSNSALNRRYINNEIVLKNIAKEGKFDRNIWGLFSLELWQQEFHDKAQQYKQLIK